MWNDNNDNSHNYNDNDNNNNNVTRIYPFINTAKILTRKPTKKEGIARVIFP